MVARGVVLTYETTGPGDTWHLDEVLVTINGTTH